MAAWTEGVPAELSIHSSHQSVAAPLDKYDGNVEDR